MTRIATTFPNLQAQRKKALIPVLPPEVLYGS